MGNKLVICCISIEHKNEDDKNIEEYDNNNEDKPTNNLINQQQHFCIEVGLSKL